MSNMLLIFSCQKNKISSDYYMPAIKNSFNNSFNYNPFNLYLFMLPLKKYSLLIAPKLYFKFQIIMKYVIKNIILFQTMFT